MTVEQEINVLSSAIKEKTELLATSLLPYEETVAIQHEVDRLIHRRRLLLKKDS